MRREGERQTKCRCQLRAKATRPQQCDGHIAVLSGNCLHHLPRLLRPQICPQLFQKLRKIIAGLAQIPPESPHRLKIGARSPSQPEVDSSRIQRLESPKLLGHHQWRVIRQHDSTAADANRLRGGCYMPIRSGVAEQASPEME